ncbi:hypothetical protein SAMN05216315_103145 [Nitrosospira sp. Nsp18]|nr:hypothetical protein SAMN05216315_103145 [Nitrosospira sp. Nsp18]
MENHYVAVFGLPWKARAEIVFNWRKIDSATMKIDFLPAAAINKSGRGGAV